MNRQMEEYKAYRKEVYSEYPEVMRFESTKKMLGIALLCYTCILFVLKISITPVDFSDTWSFAQIYMGFLVQVVLLRGAMGPKWKSAWLLGLLIFNQMIVYFQSLRQAGVDSWEGFLELHRYGLLYHPMALGIDILTYVYLLLVLLFGLWLTLIPAHRQYADQADSLEQEIKAYFKSR